MGATAFQAFTNALLNGQLVGALQALLGVFPSPTAFVNALISAFGQIDANLAASLQVALQAALDLGASLNLPALVNALVNAGANVAAAFNAALANFPSPAAFAAAVAGALAGLAPGINAVVTAGGAAIINLSSALASAIARSRHWRHRVPGDRQRAAQRPGGTRRRVHCGAGGVPGHRQHSSSTRSLPPRLTSWILLSGWQLHCR